MPNLEIYPVTPERWADMEALFEGRGGPHNCWCMVWRKNQFAKAMPGKAGKKAAMQQRVVDGVTVGLLAYADGEPVAWCSIGPRDTYRKLGGDESLANVWSLVCFFVTRPLRGQGVSRQLLDAAVAYARERGADYVEAYPVEPDSPSYRFMGRVPLFEQAGFEFVQMVGTRRHVMLLSL